MKGIAVLMVMLSMMTGFAVGRNKYIADGFYYSEINSAVEERISGVSYPKGADIGPEELRYVRILHYDFDGNVKTGELIVHKELAREVCVIFYELYKAEYPLTSVRLVDEFDADDEKSMAANNTSAFNYRVVEGTNTLSMHGRGMAIDINPLLNPCVRGSEVFPANAGAYADRSREFAGKIDKSDLAYRLFTQAGWKWGGDWNSLKDYQHFEKEV